MWTAVTTKLRTVADDGKCRRKCLAAASSSLLRLFEGSEACRGEGGKVIQGRDEEGKEERKEEIRRQGQ